LAAILDRRSGGRFPLSTRSPSNTEQGHFPGRVHHGSASERRLADESNVKDKVVFASPKDEEERALVAGACVRKLGIEIPAVIDEFGNSTEQAYTGWPIVFI